jgi:hypothetical protein
MLRRENGIVTMKLRHPYTTASIWSSMLFSPRIVNNGLYMLKRENGMVTMKLWYPYTTASIVVLHAILSSNSK